MRNHAQQEEDAEINMTPMLDIVFIMLIFFIVTAVFVKDAGVEVVKPGAQTALVQKNISIIVGIDEEDRIWIDRQQVELDAVRTTIERLHAENPKGSVGIKVDKEADTVLALDVRKAIQDAGVERIAFATEVD